MRIKKKRVAYNKAYYKKNRDKISTYKKDYYKKNREKYLKIYSQNTLNSQRRKKIRKILRE